MVLIWPGIGTETKRSSRAGWEEEPLAAPNVGVAVPEMREPIPERAEAEDVEDEPEKMFVRRSRTSNSEPVGPRDVLTSIDAGRRRFALE